MSPYAAPIVVETATANTPIANEIRAPQRTRANTSRERSSVPKRCASDGGVFLSRTMSSCSTQLCGVRSGPAIAATTSTAIAISDHRARPLPSKFAQVESRLFTDARVESRVEGVGEEVPDDDEHRADDHGRGDQIVVSAGDRPRGEEPHSGPRKNLLDEYRSADQSGQKDAEQDDDRCERSPQRVPPDHV